MLNETGLSSSLSSSSLQGSNSDITLNGVGQHNYFIT